MSTARIRLALVLLGVAVSVACDASSSVAPRQLKPVTATRDEGDTVENSFCRSGYSTAMGRCTGE